MSSGFHLPFLEWWSFVVSTVGVLGRSEEIIAKVIDNKDVAESLS